MKEYKYIYCSDLGSYNDWEIVQVIPSKEVDMVIIMKENKPIQEFIKLNEATNKQLLEELIKRLKEVNEYE